MTNRILFVLLFLIIIVSNTKSYCQIDSNFILVRKADTAKFSFKVFSNPEQFRNVTRMPLPLYGFNGDQLSKVQTFFSAFLKLEAQEESFRLECKQKDTIYKALLFYYKERDSINNLRVGNYQEAYTSLLTYNSQLNNYVKECEATALKQRRRSNINSTLFGILGGLVTGTIIGVIIK